MIHTYTINGIPLRTGDIICTMDGKPNILPGEFWRLVGKLVPGDIDHIVIYLGPEGRCVEAGALGVMTFEVHDGLWDAEHTMPERGMLVDTFYGAAYPLERRELSDEEEMLMREKIADYCLSRIGSPYNINFFDSEKDDAFYCSQLAYKAYQHAGIDLNTGMEMEQMPGTNVIIFPQELWDGNPHKEAHHPPHS
jgi:hypothetical protein